MNSVCAVKVETGVAEIQGAVDEGAARIVVEGVEGQHGGVDDTASKH